MRRFTVPKSFASVQNFRTFTTTTNTNKFYYYYNSVFSHFTSPSRFLKTTVVGATCCLFAASTSSIFFYNYFLLLPTTTTFLQQKDNLQNSEVVAFCAEKEEEEGKPFVSEFERGEIKKKQITQAILQHAENMEKYEAKYSAEEREQICNTVHLLLGDLENLCGLQHHHHSASDYDESGGENNNNSNHNKKNNNSNNNNNKNQENKLLHQEIKKITDKYLAESLLEASFIFLRSGRKMEALDLSLESVEMYTRVFNDMKKKQIDKFEEEKENNGKNEFELKIAAALSGAIACLEANEEYIVALQFLRRSYNIRKQYFVEKYQQPQHPEFANVADHLVSSLHERGWDICNKGDFDDGVALLLEAIEVKKDFARSLKKNLKKNTTKNKITASNSENSDIYYEHVIADLVELMRSTGKLFHQINGKSQDGDVLLEEATKISLKRGRKSIR